jgi:hypothetical protein
MKRGKDFIYALRLGNCRAGDLFVVKAKNKEGAIRVINKEMGEGISPKYRSSWFETLGKFPSFEAFKRSEFFQDEVSEELASRTGSTWLPSSVKGVSREIGSTGLSIFGY